MKFILNAIKRYADKILEMLSDFSKIFESIQYSMNLTLSKIYVVQSITIIYITSEI